MTRLSRLGLGTVQPGANLQPITWALAEILDRQGLQLQVFSSRACFTPSDRAIPESGLATRHLDPWLMTQPICQQIFLHSARNSDLALVRGEFGSAAPSADPSAENFERLCDWLELPRVAVVDASRLGGCGLPQRPAADAVLIDRARDRQHFARLQTDLELLWNLPVLGGLPVSPALQADLEALPPSTRPSPELCQTLADRFLQYSQIGRLGELADGRGIPDFARRRTAVADFGRVHIAVAFDEVFNCYFPDTLDLLEALGATVSVFSPLRDESLPADVDIVYFGCGHPERHADALAENQCMLMALRNHICGGRRVYAEGGGLAYLCSQLELADGRRVPLVGALPALARRNPQPQPPRPAELVLGRDCWLGAAGSPLRGYVSSSWLLEPLGQLTNYVRGSTEPGVLVGRHQVIGSRMQLNFAAHPGVLGRFFEPCPAALDCIPLGR